MRRPESFLRVAAIGALVLSACAAPSNPTFSDPGSGTAPGSSNSTDAGRASVTPGHGNSGTPTGPVGSLPGDDDTEGGGADGDSGSSGADLGPPSIPPSGSDDASTAPPPAVPGCGSSLLSIPSDPGARGPWKVGVQTVTIGRLTAEVTYPALPGSEQGKPEVSYSAAQWLPGTEATKIKYPTYLTPVGGDLYRDLPIDSAHGPYPVIIDIHGTASFRVANISSMTHWASRGFVVVSADYPGLYLHDMLASTIDCNLPTTGSQDVPGDVTTQITALTSPSGGLSFLAGHIDVNRLGVTGHSQGACITATLTTDPHVQVVVPMAGSVAVDTSSSLKGLMFIAGMNDQIIGYDTPLGTIGNVVCLQGNLQQSDTGAYTASPGPPGVNKRLVGITGGGHLVPTDLCTKNGASPPVDAAHEAINDGVCGVNDAVIIGLGTLDDCGTIDMDTGIADVNYASTAAFEDVLMCTDRSAAFANLQQALPTVGDYHQATN
jgi:dienelactone hydrolase